MRGGAIMLQERFDVDAVLNAVESDGVTMMKIVPTVLYRLLEAQRRRPRDLSGLRLIMYGAAPMQEHLIREAMDVFGCGFAQTYGSPPWFRPPAPGSRCPRSATVSGASSRATSAPRRSGSSTSCR